METSAGTVIFYFERAEASDAFPTHKDNPTRTFGPVAVASTLAALGLLSLLIVDHVESGDIVRYTTTAAAAQAAGATGNRNRCLSWSPLGQACSAGKRGAKRKLPGQDRKDEIKGAPRS